MKFVLWRKYAVRRPLPWRVAPTVFHVDLAARSTVGQIAAAAKVSHHKAAQAIDVVRNAPELADQVVNGQRQ